jgi:hypothetical protein
MTTDKVGTASLRLAATAEENGGAYEEPEAYRGSSARTMFDRPNAKDGTVTVLVPEDEIANMPRQSLVKIKSYDRRAKKVDGEYIAMVVAGPFSEPDAMNADAPTLKLPAVHRAVLTPKFHGIANVEIMGIEVTRTGGAKPVMIPAQHRPSPNSPVFLLPADRVEQVLGLAIPPEDKPIRLGLMEGAADVKVNIPANRKSVLPRHVGVLGTTGGGKSTTVSGLASRLAGSGNAVVLFDIEGEYAALCSATDDPAMLAALGERGLKPAGVASSRLYVLHGREAAYDQHPDKKFFKLSFEDISVHVLMEILDLTDPQKSRFEEAYEVCKVVMEKAKIFPATPADQQQALDLDELDGGWPKMTIDMMLDIVTAAIGICNKETEFKGVARAFKGYEETVFQTVKVRDIEKNRFSWLAIAKRLWRLKKADVFATREADRIQVDEMLDAGKISIIDLSDMDAPYIRNIVIAQILRRLQSCQDTRYKEREAADGPKKDAMPLVPMNIFIEEAHEFLSDQRIKQMPNLFEQVVRIARRGRKRHLGIVFITQLPGHLPDEVLGLINNWVLHKISDANVIQRLRKIIPAVDDGTWNMLPNLAPGHALASFTHMARPVLVSVDPTPCKLLMVE